jgi:hypothetical protein
MADTSQSAALSLAARQRTNVDFGSGNAELQRVTLTQDSTGPLQGNRLPIDRDAVIEEPCSDLRNQHDEIVPGKSSAKGTARGGVCHRDDLMNWRQHFTGSPRRVEESTVDRAASPPTTLDTVKPPRHLRTRLRPDPEHKDYSHG